MSQKKVDQYKEFKKNRKEEIEKEKRQQKRNALIGKIVAGVLILAVVAALGITVYNAIKRNADAAPQYDRENLVVEDMARVFATTTAVAETTTAAPETTTAPETTANDVETTTAAPETTTAAP